MDNFIKEIERLLKNNDIQKVKDKCNDIIEKEKLDDIYHLAHKALSS